MLSGGPGLIDAANPDPEKVRVLTVRAYFRRRSLPMLDDGAAVELLDALGNGHPGQLFGAR